MSEHDELAQIYEAWVPESECLLIMFSGLAAGYRPRQNLFNYMALTRKYNHNKIFLRDPRQVSYHLGIEGITKNLQGTVDYIGERIAQRPIKKIALLGTSAGGYAALAFGHLLNADEVHAFSPQTFIDTEHRKLKEILNHTGVNTEYFDLKPMLEDSPNGKTAFHLYYCYVPDRDRAHAERLGGLPGVHLHRYERGGHQLASYLAHDGTLDQIVAKMFEGTPA